jgi:hypothetical protein
VLLLYDINNDRFAPDVASYRKAISTMSGHRNFFAIPEEMTDSLPIEAAIASSAADL